MKKPILLLQFRTDESLHHERKYIIKFSGLKPSNFHVVNLLDPNSTLPSISNLSRYSAVITAASGQFNITDWPKNIELKITPIKPFLKTLVKREIPTLAICFGHQLVAQLFGGQVTRDPDQAETGTHQIHLTEPGKNSPLFQNLPSSFFAVLGHKDSVTQLPPGAIHLAFSDNCQFQSYRLGKNFYSVQFHPELDLDGLIWRLMLYPEYLKATNQTLSQIKSKYHQIPHAKKVISNFITLASRHSF